jgi:predicted TIM-barrel fold metal-dependent hydrolase
MMYLDTVSYHEPALMCAINTVGADHMLLGADAPPLSPLLPRARKLVEALPIPQDQKDGILGLNALKLMNLPVPTQ